MSEPTEIAIAVVEHEGRFLVGRRPEGVALAGFWEFPGGKVEPGEDPRQTAARECLEETGLAVDIGEPYPEVLHTYPHGTLRLRFYRATPLDAGQSPHSRFQWVARGDLREYEFPEANQALLDLLCAEPADADTLDLRFWLAPAQVLVLLAFVGLSAGIGRLPPTTARLLVVLTGLALLAMSVINYRWFRNPWSLRQLYFDATALAVTGVFAWAAGWYVLLVWIPLLLVRRLE